MHNFAHYILLASDTFVYSDISASPRQSFATNADVCKNFPTSHKSLVCEEIYISIKSEILRYTNLVKIP